MFKVKDSTIHCSRGDAGTISLKLPLTDSNNYIKYEDGSENIYWYDSVNKILYDSDYEVSSTSLDTLSVVYYEFQQGDKVKMNVYNKKGYDKQPVMSKEIVIDEDAYIADIPLTEEDTSFGTNINKATTFWYDITLNEDLTVVCYNEDGAKEFILYPARGDGE